MRMALRALVDSLECVGLSGVVSFMAGPYFPRHPGSLLLGINLVTEDG